MQRFNLPFSEFYGKPYIISASQLGIHGGLMKRSTRPVEEVREVLILLLEFDVPTASLTLKIFFALHSYLDGNQDI